MNETFEQKAGLLLADEERRNSGPFVLPLPDLVVEHIAERAAELVLRRLDDEGQGRAASPFLTVPEAARYLCCRPQRIYDLLSTRRLTRFKDGRRVLVRRAELDARLAGTGSSPVARALPHTAQRRTTSRLAE